MYGYGFRFKPYVSVAQRRAKAERKLKQLAKKGYTASPVKIAGRTIATTFWGKAWCDHLESFSDFENRLPRGRTYVRNGSVVDLKIEAGRITAMVSGSELYRITIAIDPLAKKLWQAVQARCAGRIGSLIELLQGKLSNDVMQVVAHREQGLFPQPDEIEMNCSCPDWAGMCKHLAATLYGIGARLDQQPELLFKLRQVNHHELITSATELAEPTKQKPRGNKSTIAAENLADVFGIEIEGSSGAARESAVGTTIEKPKSSAKPAKLLKQKTGEVSSTRKTPRKASKRAIDAARPTVAVDLPQKLPRKPKSKTLRVKAKRSIKAVSPSKKLKRLNRPR